MGIAAVLPVSALVIYFAVGAPGAIDPAAGVATGRQTPHDRAELVAVADQLKGVAERLGTTLPMLALAWVLQQPAVSVALAGIRKPEEIEHNIGALDVRLAEDDLRAMDGIMAGAAGQVDASPT